MAQISHSWGQKSKPPLPSKGMHNPGRLCYRNGVLQALLHIPKFVNWIEQAHPVVPYRRCSTASAALYIGCLQSVGAKEMSSKHWPIFRLLFGMVSSLFRRSFRHAKLCTAGWIAQGQQDANHFYIWLVATLQQQLPAYVLILSSTLHPPNTDIGAERIGRSKQCSPYRRRIKCNARGASTYLWERVAPIPLTG